MKKVSLSLLTAATVAIGAISFTAPIQAATATAITPNIDDTVVYKSFYFTSYPPQWYSDEETQFAGGLVKVTDFGDGTYMGEYKGSYYN